MNHPPCAFVWLDEVDSTNRHARDELAHLADATLVVAAAQTGGRGRRGRTWLSPPGQNLYATFVVKDWPHLQVAATWLASLATLDLLRQTAPGLELWLKWPNDLFCGDRKLCGVLCETCAPDGLLIGIGVNLNMPPSQLAMIDQPATSILAETGRSTDIGNFARSLGKILTRMYRTAVPAGTDALFRRWRDENRVVGRTVRLLADDGSETTGIVEDLDENGAILLSGKRGRHRTFYSGDVSLKPPADHDWRRVSTSKPSANHLHH